MHFDLELILVVGVLLTGGIWLLDKLWLGVARGRAGAVGAAFNKTAESDVPEVVYEEPWYVEYAKSFFPVLLIVLVLRSFIAEPFRIPSGSMMPTLLVGDFILVNKFAYGVRLPVLNTKVIDNGEPKRGDVVVFRYPLRPSDDYIKRVIGLPGDKISYYNNMLYINGEPMPQQPVAIYQGVGRGQAMTGANVHEEKLADVTHQVLLDPNRRFNRRHEVVVPPGQFFVMGDNRDHSNDSRYWGFVPEDNLVGKAFLIWMNWDPKGGVFDSSRVGQKIK